VSVTVKVTTPLEFVTPPLLPAEIVELPLSAASVTVLPGTTLPFISLIVTVIVEAVVPLSVTEAGLAPIVDVPAFPGSPTQKERLVEAVRPVEVAESV
jgi:hypothetical protein